MTLRLRILSLALGAALAVLLLFAVPLLLLEARSASDDLEQSATATARGVADYVSASGSDRSEVAAYVARVNEREDDTPVAVVAPDGTTYGADLPGATTAAVSGTPDDPDPDADGDRDGPFLQQSGADVVTVAGGRLIRVQVRTQGAPTTVLAYVSDADVRSAAAAHLWPLAGAATLLVLLVGSAAELVSRRLVRDLDRTADLADTIAAGDIVARVPETGPPEVRRVAHALNGLAGRIDELLAAERETAADLSHRLRTPLTALRLDVELLPDGQRTDLESHVDNLERTLTAVIHEARRTAREGARAGCRPGPVLTASAAYWQPLIEDQGRPVEVAVADELPEVRCAAEDLRAAIDALIENAIAHTPDRTAVAIRARVDADAPHLVVIEIADRGPGFAADAVRRGRSDRGSTGLGLDIARRCARASGGELVVAREAGWTVVRLRLGPAAPGPAQQSHRGI
ncbi:HAMP domain-containing sensor histidine kinase [Nocardioides sp. L-11A]|uniref:sensor histidine kinase n=1 Tax=Nocardioides sp. L-11A TaxID=3043848 RepID=UPI00249BF816|nr:HAMP domain-containing sensor histidine kinase [Nocardioides sp. L-11A]